jgi:acetyl-CoA C-acetyltransferase
MSGVWILGGYQTDFARNLTREGKDFADLFAETVPATIAAAGNPDLGVVHVGNAFGQLYTGQGHLGSLPATVEPALSGIPGARHEAACASGGIALLAAMADLESGRYDTALVMGAELEKTVDGGRAAELMAAASWVGHEAEGQRYVWPWAFDEIAAEYDRRYGLPLAHLRAIG